MTPVCRLIRRLISCWIRRRRGCSHIISVSSRKINTFKPSPRLLIILFFLLLLAAIIVVVTVIVIIVNVTKPPVEVDVFDVNPLLTMFTIVMSTTTADSGDSSSSWSRENILQNRTFFPSTVVRRVLFTDDNALADKADKLDWVVLQLPVSTPGSESGSGEGGVVLKEMYRAVYRKFTSMLYGFAAADLVFQVDSLVATLRGIRRDIHRLEYDVLLTGKQQNRHRRTQTQTASKNGTKFSSNSPLSNTQTLRAIDVPQYYFFTRKGCWLNWLAVPETIKVGPSGCPRCRDFISIASRDGVNIVDASPTLFLQSIDASKSSRRSLKAQESSAGESIKFDDYDIRLRTIRRLDGEVSVIHKDRL